MFEIFKEFLSHSDSYNGNSYALILNTLGGSLIGITFLIIGAVYICMSSKAKSGRRRRLSTLFGLFLISCSFSRLFSVICIWHNYAIVDGLLKVLTGMLAFLAIIYIPKTVKEVLEEDELNEATRLLEKTQKELYEVKRLSETITSNK